MVDPSTLPELEPELREAVNIYIAFMEEIKVRLNAIEMVVNDLKANPDRSIGFLQAESGFLQFRLICESITLAALAAHSPYGLSEDLMDSWNARLAFQELARLNPQCFPRAIKVIRPESGIHIEFVPDSLTRRAFMRHYLKCGRMLHRGAIRHALEGETRVYDIDALDLWARQVGALLTDHTMMMLQHGVVLLVHMTAGPGGSVRVAISKAQGPSVLVEPDTESAPADREDEQSPQG